MTPAHPAAAQADAASVERGALGSDEYHSLCAVCRRVTVWRIVCVAGKLTVICLECRAS